MKKIALSITLIFLSYTAFTQDEKEAVAYPRYKAAGIFYDQDYTLEMLGLRLPRDRLQGEVAAAAGPVFDDDRLPQPLRQPLADQAGDDVGRAAGADEDHDGDRPGRISLRAAQSWVLQRVAWAARSQSIRKGETWTNLVIAGAISSSWQA